MAAVLCPVMHWAIRFFCEELYPIGPDIAVEHPYVGGSVEYADIPKYGFLQGEGKIPCVRECRSESYDTVFVGIFLADHELCHYAVYEKDDKGSKKRKAEVRNQLAFKISLEGNDDVCRSYYIYYYINKTGNSFFV